MLVRRRLALVALGVFTSCGRGRFDSIDAPDPATVGPVLAVAAGGLHTCALLSGGRVRCWGFNSNGELGRGNADAVGEGVPTATGDVDVGAPVTQIATGQHHTCALLEGGHVRCWGSNLSGQLGYGNTTAISASAPPSAAGDVDVGGTVVQIKAGDASTCALLDTGAVRCWGDNSVGQLGRGNTDLIGDNETPASAGDIDLGGTATKIAVGDHHACALLGTGSVRCWGDGTSGRLGYASTARIGDNETPAGAGDVDVGGPVVDLAAGGQHTCAILATGAVRCWGAGGGGRLGYGNTSSVGDTERPSSAGDVDLGGIAIQIAAAGLHTCAVLDTGAVRCWGSAQQGRLGHANLADIGDDETPRTAGDVDIGGPVTQIATGAAHTCAIVAGHVRCWGAAAHGRLGHGGASITIGDDETPAARPVLQLGGPADQITAGGDHACALLTGGNVVCWGSNANGQNGNPTRDAIGDDETPGAAGPIALGGSAVEIAAGSQHTCARLTTGAVRCWGFGSSGRLGYANTTSIGNNETPSSAGDIILGAAATAIALGTNHTCAVIAGGAVRCWGSNTKGQLGYANTTPIGDTQTPASVIPVVVGGAVAQLALGNARTCALLTAGTVRCWGDNATGVLGYGNMITIGDDEDPAAAGDLDIEIGHKVTQLTYAGAHGCALLDDGSVRCWGSGTDGQLGHGSTNTIGNNETPRSAGPVQVGGTVTKLAAGANHTCALLSGGGVRCWGLGAGGRLGYGNTATIGDNELPLSAGTVDIGGTAIDIAAGDSHTCAVLSDRTVRCWGDDHGTGLLGQAIVNDIGDDETPASVGDVAVP